MKYNIRRKRLNIVRKEMKQRIKAASAKIKRFNSRIKQYRQNNQGRFFQRLNNEEVNHQYEFQIAEDAEWRRTLRCQMKKMQIGKLLVLGMPKVVGFH